MTNILQSLFDFYLAMKLLFYEVEKCSYVVKHMNLLQSHTEKSENCVLFNLCVPLVQTPPPPQLNWARITK